MFKNIFVSFKTSMLLGFLSLILMLLVASGVSLNQFYQAKQATTELNNSIIPLVLSSDELLVDLIKVQQFFADVAATHQQKGYQDAEEVANNFKQSLAKLAESSAISVDQKERLQQLNNDFDKVFAQGKEMTSLYLNQNIEAGNLTKLAFDVEVNTLASSTKKLKQELATDKLVTQTNTLFTDDQASFNLIIFVSIVLTLLSAGIIFSLITLFYKQLGVDPLLVNNLAKEIAQGNFKNTIELQDNDRSSLLYAIKCIQDSINDFIDDIDNVITKQIQGAINEEFNHQQFSGDYKRTAQNLNTLVKYNIDVKMEIAKVISQYAQGDFSYDIKRFPGDQAKITRVIDEIKNNLHNVGLEIKILTEAGVKGDFSKRVNTSKYSYMFKEIFDDFNLLFSTSEAGFIDILHVTNSMAKGDLNQSIDKNYPGIFGEVIESINATNEHLKSLLLEIKEATETINTAAKEIASGNNDLSHRTEEQAASLEETAASMEELTSTVQANTQNAKQADELARSAAAIADKGVNVVSKVVTTMESINTSSNKIVAIISVIDSIAFQTNILALNAAVEAARAGEQGRGFAVVASEVRNLAQRAAAAAGEIKKLIGDSVEKVEDGSKLVLQAGHTMEEIVSSIHRVTVIMNEIAEASIEQTSGIQQVNQAIGQMDDATQQNAALVEEAAASAESLEDQVHSLLMTVNQFKVDGRQAHDTSTLSKTAASKSPAPIKIETYKGKTAAAPKPVLISNDDIDEWEEF